MTDRDVEKTQPLTEHLLELRTRLLRSLLVMLVIFAGLFNFSNEIYEWVSIPLLQALPEGSQMIATDVTSPFFAPFKLTMVVALFLAAPYILGEIWGFIAPGLYKEEKRLLVPVLATSILLFYAGISFAYFVVFPLIFTFFSSVGPESVAYTPDISRFLDTTLKLFFAFGVAFEIPIATVILIHTGATTAKSLASKRPYVIVGCFIVGMLLTPPDPISQALMAIPMWLLFEVGILFGRFIGEKKTTDEANDSSSAEEN
ncbi:Sec-independent protein translocase protein TatC [BD1-7 clade bacterium]|uniref:Sec-independent protein translocase protein TatC n=1 Tax=BD1-7 clade bacterium TaxID=2029982 RepID=A0A5S9QEM1_9GAMM|nr:Sec-independent protein translocase protein TatC [BD1-7 clade bacterium]